MLPDIAKFCRSCGERQQLESSREPIREPAPEPVAQTSIPTNERNLSGAATATATARTPLETPISPTAAPPSFESTRAPSFGEEVAVLDEKTKAQHPPNINRRTETQAPYEQPTWPQKKGGGYAWKIAAWVLCGCIVIVGASATGLYLYKAEIQEANAKAAALLAAEQAKVREEKAALLAREAQMNSEKARINKQEEEQKVERERQAAANVVATPVVAEASPIKTSSGESAIALSTNCSDLESCTDAALFAVSPRDAMALEVAIARIDALEKPTRGNRRAARRSNEQGLQQLEMGNLSEAMELLAKAAIEDPADVEIMSNLGEAAIRGKSVVLAQKALQLATLLNPRRAVTWVANAELMLQKGGASAQLAPRALLLAYEYSGNREKTIAYFDGKAISSDSEDVRRLYDSTSKRIRVEVEGLRTGG